MHGFIINILVTIALSAVSIWAIGTITMGFRENDSTKIIRGALVSMIEITFFIVYVTTLRPYILAL